MRSIPHKGTETLQCGYHSRGSLLLQLIPARGRKLPAGYVHDRVHDITAYPRKGTVTGTCRHQRGLSSITTYPRKGTETGSSPLKNVSTFNYNFSPQGDKKAPPHWFVPAAEGLCFSDSSVLGSAGGRSGGDGRINGNCLDALRDVPLQGADLMQVGGDLLQGIFNVLGIQRQNALAL